MNDPAQSNKDKLITVDNISGIDIPLTLTQIQYFTSLIEQHEQINFNLLEFVFVNQEEIKRINGEFLDHHYITDVITFPYGDEEVDGIEATIYGCAQQITNQASLYETSELEEYSRIVVHALLHLAGYNDTDDKSTQKMRQREQFYLERI